MNNETTHEKISEGCTRRTALAGMAGLSAAAGVALTHAAPAQAETAALKGRIKQSVSRWCFDKIPMDEFCVAAKAMGLVGVDLLSEADWAVVQSHGLQVALANGPGKIPDGFNDPKNHDTLVKGCEELFPKLVAAAVPNVVVFSGNRKGMDDKEGLKNCVKGLKRITPLAEKLGVNVVMELLNSKRSHKDYMCDLTAWGVELCKQVESPRFKLLYDIFHMQIMEGDVISTLQENIAYIGHIHTGGVPGRHEIDDTQELNYRRICQAIVEANFTGFVAHEFSPKSDQPLESLRQAVQICDV